MLELQLLDLSHNPGLNGSLPEAWGQPGAMPSLRSLDVSNCGLSGTLPAWGSAESDGLAKLQTLNIVRRWPAAPGYRNSKLHVSGDNPGCC